MKILVLSSQASNTGSTLRAEYIFKYLKKSGAESSYVRPPFPSLPFMLDFLLSMPYYFFKIMNRKYDFILIVKPYPNTVLPAVMLKQGGAKLIIDIDDLDYGYRRGIFSWLIRIIQKKLVPFAQYITSHNDELIKLIKREFPAYKNRIIKLNQCVDTSIFSPKKARKKYVKQIRSAYNGKKIFFYMANLNIASCLEEIITAMKRLKEENAVLLVAGGGPLYNSYRKMVLRQGLSGAVKFTGPLELKETVDYIEASDICLVYYRNEKVNKYRASMKLREYLAMKKPVIATGVGEILNFRQSVYLTPASVKRFAEEMKKRVKCLDNRHKKGYKLVEKEFTWGKEIRGFYSVLKKGEING